MIHLTSICRYSCKVNYETGCFLFIRKACDYSLPTDISRSAGTCGQLGTKKHNVVKFNFILDSMVTKHVRKILRFFNELKKGKKKHFTR